MAFELLPQQVEKDYVHSWVLWALNSRPELRRLLILKGGNALRKGYLPETRFSKDLDFSSVEHVDPGFLAAELREMCSLVERQTGVRFIRKEAARQQESSSDFPIIYRGCLGFTLLLIMLQISVLAHKGMAPERAMPYKPTHLVSDPASGREP